MVSAPLDGAFCVIEGPLDTTPLPGNCVGLGAAANATGALNASATAAASGALLKLIALEFLSDMWISPYFSVVCRLSAFPAWKWQFVSRGRSPTFTTRACYTSANRPQRGAHRLNRFTGWSV